MPAGLEAVLIGCGIVLLSLLDAGWVREPVPEDRNCFDYGWVQSRRWSGLVCKYIGIPLGVSLIVFGVVVMIVNVVT